MQIPAFFPRFSNTTMAAFGLSAESHAIDALLPDEAGANPSNDSYTAGSAGGDNPTDNLQAFVNYQAFMARNYYSNTVCRANLKRAL